METILPGIKTNQDGAVLAHTPGQSQSWATTGILHRTEGSIIASMTARLVVLGRDPMALYCTAEKIEGGLYEDGGRVVE